MYWELGKTIFTSRVQHKYSSCETHGSFKTPGRKMCKQLIQWASLEVFNMFRQKRNMELLLNFMYQMVGRLVNVQLERT